MSTVASPSVPSDILARLRSFGNSQVSTAEPSGGFRWPAPGNGQFLCRGATIKQENRKFGDVSVPAVSLTLKWKWLDDPDVSFVSSSNSTSPVRSTHRHGIMIPPRA